MEKLAAVLVSVYTVLFICRSPRRLSIILPVLQMGKLKHREVQAEMFKVKGPKVSSVIFFLRGKAPVAPFGIF